MTDAVNVGGVQATLGLDAEGFKKGMDEAKAGMKQVTDEAKKFNQDFKGVSKSLRDAGVDSKGIRKIKTELLSLKPDVVEKQLANVDKQLKAMGVSSEHIARIKQQMQGIEDEAQKTTRNFSNLSTVIGTIGAGAALSGIIETVRTLTHEAQQLSNAYKGLTEVSKSVGQNTQEVQKAVDDLVQRGFMSATEAATAFKTSLAAGYDLQQSIQLINALSDAAAYNREAHLGWGEAVVQAIQGIKQQESSLTDAAGVTTNLSVMYDRYAASIGKSAAKLTDAEKLQAAYNGMMQEASLFAGNAASAMDGYTGTQAHFNQTIVTARQELGAAFIPILEDIMKKVGPLIASFTTWVTENKELIVGLTAGATAVLGLITVLGTLAVAVGAVTAALGAMNLAMGPIGWTITGIAVLTAGFATYKVASDAASKSTLEFAENQELLNQKLKESPANRTAEDVKKLQDDVKTLNDLLEQRAQWQERLNQLNASGGSGEVFGGMVSELDIAKAAVEGFDEKLKELDFENVDQAKDKLKEMRSELEKSVPALIQVTKSELQDVAAKNSKVLEMEKLVKRYQELDKAQKLDEAKKQELVTITNTLKAQYPGLNALMDEQGRIRIQNIDTVNQQIGVEKSLVSASVESAKSQITNLRNTAAAQKAAVEAQIKNYQQLASVMSKISGKALSIGASSETTGAKKVLSIVGGIAAAGVEANLNQKIGEKSTEQNKYAAAELEAERALANLTSGNLDAFKYSAPNYGGGATDSTKKAKTKKGTTKQASGKSAAEIAKDQRKEAYDAAMATARYMAEYYDQTADQQIKALEKIKVAHKVHLKESIEDEREMNLQIKHLREDSAKSNYDASTAWISREQRRMEESGASEVKIAQMKVESWERLRNKYGKESEFYKNADDQLYQARKDLVQAQYNFSAEWIDKEERRMEESGKSEMQINQMKLDAWTRVRDRYKKDSDEYKKADEEVYRAQKSLLQDMTKETESLVSVQKKSMESALQAELDAIEQRKKAFVDEQDAKIKALDDLMKKEDQANSDLDYEAKLAEKRARQQLLSTAVSPEGKKELADITAEIERMELEHSRDIRRRDLEDQKQSLEDEKDDREKAFDQEKEDAETRYQLLSDAFENYQDNVQVIEEAIKNFRIGANEEANQAVLSGLDTFLEQYKAKMASVASISGVSNPDLDLQEYNANKDAWQAAKERGDTEEMARLSARNEQLRKLYNISKDTGKLPNFDVGGIVPGPPGAPMPAIVHGGEAIFNQQHLENLFRLLEVPRLVPVANPSNPNGSGDIINHIDMSVNGVELSDKADIQSLYDEREQVARRLQTRGVKSNA
ncbi:hypothetical protein [Paenibacillus sp. OAE614]|uniref:hypothetical protein n=1 Tax=Paenibacillus sp. OAE614 TaxID=2663804 RepID=UPI00178ACC66